MELPKYLRACRGRHGLSSSAVRPASGGPSQQKYCAPRFCPGQLHRHHLQALWLLCHRRCCHAHISQQGSVHLPPEAGRQHGTGLLHWLPADSIGSLLQLLAERIQFAADGRVISAVDAIDQHKGNIRIREVFENIPGSQRHLNKLFKQQVGLTPKEYASIVRLQAMYNLYIRDHQWENKDHLYDLYYDESHFLQNFRKVFAQRPRQFMRAPNQLGNAFNK